MVHLDCFLSRLSGGSDGPVWRSALNTRLFRAITAAMLVIFLTLLFDYCRYEIEHHPHFDFTRVIYLSIQGVVISINFVAMLKFLESFNSRA